MGIGDTGGIGRGRAIYGLVSLVFVATTGATLLNVPDFDAEAATAQVVAVSVDCGATGQPIPAGATSCAVGSRRVLVRAVHIDPTGRSHEFTTTTWDAANGTPTPGQTFPIRRMANAPWTRLADLPKWASFDGVMAMAPQVGGLALAVLAIVATQFRRRPERRLGEVPIWLVPGYYRHVAVWAVFALVVELVVAAFGYGSTQAGPILITVAIVAVIGAQYTFQATNPDGTIIGSGFDAPETTPDAPVVERRERPATMVFGRRGR